MTMEREPCEKGLGVLEQQNSLRGSQEEQAGQEQPSCHALHSTWEDIYQRELEAAAARKAYAWGHPRITTANNSVTRSTRSRRGRSTSSRNDSIDSRSSGRSSSRSSESSDGCSLDGEEWFGPECEKIARWICSTLSRQQNNPLQPYICALHASREKTCEDAVCRDDQRVCCMQMYRCKGAEYLSLPLLDMGCGGGQFLARLRRHGFLRLAGIDYSASAIRLAKANLLHSKTPKNTNSTAHICLRQGDIRDLQPETGPSADTETPFCVCCCNKTRGVSKSVGHECNASDDKVANGSLHACEPLKRVPPFPVMLDKGTFDVFWLMRTPQVYVQCMHRLMPRHGLLFLTSCNCTVEELDSIFGFGAGTRQQQQAVETAGPGGSNSVAQKFSRQEKPCEPVGADTLAVGMASLCVDSDSSATECQSGSPALSPAFERIGVLPHRSFKFGGVEGQVVTSVLLRRL